jgi:hypothetical protein
VSEGARKHYSGSDVSGYVKEKQEAGDPMGRGMVFLDGVGWTGFVETKGEEQGAGRVSLARGAEGAETSMREGGTYTLDLAYKEDTG